MAKLIPSSKYSESQQQQQRRQFLQITQNGKFYSRLLSKESSIANPSLRVYYGGAPGAVPFVWESQPGTPKPTATANPLPPLTPPPSHHFNHTDNNKKKKKASMNPPKSILIQRILPRPKKNPTTTTTTTTTTTHSPSSSVSFSSTSTSSRAEDEDSVDFGSPTSTLRGCYSMLTMKNVLLSIVGGRHGSSQGAQP